MNTIEPDSSHLGQESRQYSELQRLPKTSSQSERVRVLFAPLIAGLDPLINDVKETSEYSTSCRSHREDEEEELYDFVSDLEDSCGEEYPQSSDSESIRDLWGYRAYEPTNPCTNRLIQRRWDEDTKRAHIEKLKRIKATIDTAPPKKYPHLVTQKKRHQIKVEDATRIYHDNFNLLDRIRRQLRSSPHPNGRPTDPHPVVIVNPVVQKQGLNGPRKRILQEQMESENEVILQRLEASSPFYRGEEFSKERINTLLHLQNISRFPKKYVRQLKDAGVQFPRVPEKKSRPLTARTDEAAIISKYELKDPHLFNHYNQQVIIRKPKLEQSSNDSIVVPPRYGTRGPLVPRVAMLPPKKVIPLESLIPVKPVKPVPLVPRCALLPQRRPLTATEPIKQIPAKHTIYEDEPAGEYTYEDEFPGDEDLIITNDSWDAKLSISRAITRLNEEGLVEEKREETRYNFGDRSGEVAILCGVPAFGASFQYPRVVNFSLKIYVSSIDGDSEEERACWIKNYLLQLRRFCISFGKEVCWHDFKFGRDNVVTNLNNYRKVCLADMDACHKESSFVSSMIFFNNSMYGDRAIPTDIDAQVFKKILNQAKYMDFRDLMAKTNNNSAEELLKKWYRLDENYVPKRFILRRIEEILTNIDSLDERESAKRVWIFQNLNPLKEILRRSAVRLSRQGLLEPHIAQRFVQSDFQEEITRGVIQESRRGGWERSLLLVNTEHVPKVSSGSGGMNESESENHDEQETLPPTPEMELSQDQKLLQKLIGPLFTAIPYENKIHPYLNSDEPFDRHAAMNPLFDSLLDRFKRLVSRQMINLPRPNTLLHEITTHMKHFKLKARDHSHRGHLISKIMSYITRTDKCPIPPFLLDGDMSMGKTSVVGSAIQKLVKKITEDAWIRVQATKSPLSSTIDVTSSKHDLVSDPEPLAPEKPPYEPIIVARICGLTPYSSNSRLLIDSITRQIYEAYNHKNEATEELLTVQDYRNSLSLASSERPLIIVLAKVDRLPLSGPLALKISWILDHIAPFVRILLTARTDFSATSVFSVITGKIKQMAPTVLYSTTALENRAPPSPALMATCSDDYLLNVGSIIAPIAKSSIKRLLTIDKRKLRLDQEDSLRKAFNDAETAENCKYVPIRLLKQLYKMSRKWGSYDKVGDIEFPKTLNEAFDLELSDLEVSHGYYLTMTLLSVLALSRDGLTVSELEDILSLDDLCLAETLKYSTTDLARVPSLKIAQLLYDITDYVIHRQDFGGELISISHDTDFLKCIELRYLSDVDIVNRMSELLYDYFADTYSEEKPFTLLKGRTFLVSRQILDMPWMFPPSDLCEKIYGNQRTWNVRKLREYPRSCLVADKWAEFDNILRDVHYLTGILSIQNTDRAIEDIYSFLTFDPKRYRPQRRLSITKYQDGKLILDSEVENADPEPTVAHLRAKVGIFVETMLNFLVWNRHIMDISPKLNRQNVVFDMLFRLPETSSLKAILYRAVAAVNLKSGSWNSFDLLKKRGYGILQCLPRWRPIVSVSGYGWTRPISHFPEADGEYRTDRDISTAPDWSNLRRKSMFSGGTQCILDGEKNAEYWEKTHIKPSMTLLHKNHTHCAVSQDGKYIASGSKDGILRIFDANTGFELTSLNSLGHIMALAFQPSDSDTMLISIALSSSINKLVMWSISKCMVTHEICGKPVGLGTPVISCGFLKELRDHIDYHYPQCRVYGLGLNGVLSIWDMVSKEVVKQFFPDSEDNKILATGAVALSPDGKAIVYGIRSLNLVSVKDLQLVWTRKIQPDKSPLRNHIMNKIIFSQDSKSIFMLSNSIMQNVLDPSPAIGAVFQRFDLSTKVTAMLWNLDINASHMSISTDEKCVAFGSEAGIAHIINLATGHLMICQPLSEPVISMQFIPDAPATAASGNAYTQKTNWSGKLKEEVVCYRVGIGCFKRGVVVTGFENVKDGMIRYSITTAQFSADGMFLAIIGGGDVPQKQYDPSCFMEGSLTTRVDGEIVSSLDDLTALTRQSRALQSATSTPVKSGEKRSSRSLDRRAISVMGREKTQQNSTFDPLKENVQKSYFDEPGEISTVTLWDVEAGTRLLKMNYTGNIIWCDFETQYGNDVSTFVTGDSDGNIKIWNWNAIGQTSDGKFFRNLISTANNTQIESLTFSVGKHIPNATILNYCLHQETGILAVAFTDESGAMHAQFWGIETGEKLRYFQFGLETAPILNITKSNLHLPMTWGNPSDALLRFINTKEAVSAQTIRPACLVIGLERIHVSLEFGTTRSDSIKAIVESQIGTEYTATSQSKHDPRVMIIAVHDQIYWVSEEMFPVVGRPDPPQPAVPQAPLTEERSSSTEPKRKDSHRLSMNRSSITTKPHKKYNGRRRSSSRRRSSIPKADDDPSTAVISTETPNAATASNVSRPPQEEYIPAPADYCRIRHIHSIPDESVIGLHHFKTSSVDCLIAATSNGTVIVFNLKSSNGMFRKSVVSRATDEPVKIIGIWHARTPVSGMRVREVATEAEDEDEVAPSRCRVVLWGLNGFVTVLNLQL
ncbi:hypothetical protein BDR26DRAFT_1003063 [Obelidium mucronatum]|nr:hypothetical protein BDR26DRAFT_1003063 [Obelidium mucronatum]